MRTIPTTSRDPGVTWGQLHRVYLTGPRTCLDPAGYAALTANLLELDLIAQPVEAAFASAARELRALDADVFSPFEQPWWRGAEVSALDLRAGRAANAGAAAAAHVVVVLDGWLDVPGAVDAAVIAARTAGVAVLAVAQAVSELRGRAVFTASAARRRRPAA
jgi:hypothetical protein